MPTGRLYEAGVRFLNVSHYNGTLADSNLTNMDVLRYLLAQLRSCRVAGSDTLPDLPAFNQRVQAATTAGAGVIPLAVQHLPYASIRPEALQNNLLTVQNEQLYDVPGRSQNPYQTQVLFAAAPALSYSRTDTVAFVFRRNLYLSGEGTLPSSLYLDFGDGSGYRLARWDQALRTIYPSAGTKRVKVKMVYGKPATGITRESWFDFQVLSAGDAFRYGDPASSGKQVYRIKFPGSVLAPGALVTVMYGKGHGRHVVKPLIIVEQYNIAGAAPNLVECNNANNTVEMLLDKIQNVTLQSGNTFNETLEAAGYDLIYIDFERNLASITYNAQVVEYIIQQVNAWKSTAQAQGYTPDQNVVLGMSMGGLIGRYALAEMTRNPARFGPPDTRLLVLHDSPQRGAYNPLGLQCFTRATAVPLNIALLSPSIALLQPSLSSFNGKLSDAVNVLDQPATQQLAILNAFDSRGNNIQPNTFINGVYRDMIDFTAANPNNTPSTPQPTYQLVATSDGSQCGIGSGAPLGVQLSSADTYTLSGNWLAPLVSNLSGFSLGVRGAAYGLPAYGQQALISRMRVYIEYTIKIGICPFCVKIPIRYNLLNEEATSPSNTIPYETLPGGFTNLAAESGDCSVQKFPVSLVFTTGLYNGPICFVPTYSALDVETVTPATAAAQYVNGITNNPSPPRVARYIAQRPGSTTSTTEYNLNHLTYTARNSEWIFNEMQRPFSTSSTPNPLACESAPGCDLTAGKTISGPLTLCTANSGPATYTSPLQGPGYTYTWTASPAYAFTVTSGTGPTFQTANVPGIDDTGTLTLTVNTGCAFTFSKRLVIGAPEPLVVVLDEQDDCNHIAYLHIDNYDPGLPYVISGSGVGGKVGGQFFVKNSTWHITVSNGCGTAAANGTIAWDQCQGPMAGYTVYPNPADETMTVAQTDSSSAPRSPAARGASASSSSSAPSTPYTVRLFDNYGVQQAQQSTTTPTLQLSTGTLPTGLYLLHIEAGGVVVERRRVQITH